MATPQNWRYVRGEGGAAFNEESENTGWRRGRYAEPRSFEGPYGRRRGFGAYGSLPYDEPGRDRAGYDSYEPYDQPYDPRYGVETRADRAYRDRYGPGRYDGDFGFGDGGAYRLGYGGQEVESDSGWLGAGVSRHHHEGEHRGRGPKGYTRSDERIAEDVHDRLLDDSWLDASDIEAKVDDGEVTLSGHVESRAAKHRAEHMVENISGVKHVQNNLRVRD